MGQKIFLFINLKTIFILFSVINCLFALNQRCSANSSNLINPDQKANDEQCPLNSKCSTSGFCICQRGFFGNCQNKGQFITASSQQFTINQNISFFIIQPTLNEYVYYQFILCNEESQTNEQLLNLWDDDGNLETPTGKNALGIDKYLNVAQGCTSLMTPFFTFTSQPNGQKQLLIFGIRLRTSGTAKIKLLVQEAEIFGFDILFRIILIIVGGIALVSLSGVIYCIYKCRRNRAGNPISEQKFDISFFNQYMASKKANLQQIKEQICSVCLAEYKQNQDIRPTICGHCFHKICLDQWCVTNLSCPICRTSFQKANLIHHQYLMSRQNSTEQRQDSIIEQDLVDDQNIRRPMV